MKVIRHIIIFFLIFLQYQCAFKHTKMKHKTYRLDFYTSHNQFYIYDPKSNFGDFSINNEDYNDKLVVGKGIIVAITETYGHIRLKIEILDKERKIENFSIYDHVVEGGIETKSGILQILDCPSSRLIKEIKLPQGTYRVRIYSMNLKDVIGDEDENDDSYRIEIWPSNKLEKKVLKRYQPTN